MIQPEQHLSGLNIVALVEVDVSQLAGHLRSYGDGGKRLNGADDVRVERHDFLDHPINGDGHRGLRCTRFWALRVACRTCRKHETDPEQETDKQAMSRMHWGKLHFNEYGA